MQQRLESRLVFLAVLGFFLLSHGGHFYAIDNFRVYQTAQALTQRGSLAVDPGVGTAPGRSGTSDFEGRAQPAWLFGLGTAQGRGGRSYAVWSIGLSLLEMPLVATASLFDEAWPDQFATLVGPNASRFYPENFSVFAASLVSPLFAAWGASEFWMVAVLLGYPSWVAATLTATLVLSTQYWPAARDTFPHAVVACLLLALLRRVITWRVAPTPLASGCIAGLVVLVRPFDAFLALPLLTLYLLWQESFRSQRRWVSSELALYLLPPLVATLIIGLQNTLRFESPFIFNESVGFDNPIPAGLHGLLFSVRRGVIFFSPPVVATLFGLVLLARRMPSQGLLLAALIAVYPLGYATCPQWHANLSWGPRFIAPAIPLAVLPLGELIVRRGMSRVFVLLLGVAGFAVQIGATLVDFQRAAMSEPAIVLDPGRSQIIAHWRNLLAGRFLDWMPLRLFAAHGVGAAAAYAALPVAMSTGALIALTRLLRADSINRGRRP